MARALEAAIRQPPACRVHAARARGKEGIGKAAGANHGWGGGSEEGEERRGEAETNSRCEHSNGELSGHGEALTSVIQKPSRRGRGGRGGARRRVPDIAGEVGSGDGDLESSEEDPIFDTRESQA